jgi:tRNA-2-methylthio-N6-dimethylallyladenosine synthase
MVYTSRPCAFSAIFSARAVSSAQSAAEPYLGKTVRILCDGPSKNNDAMLSGRTEGGKLVFFEGVPEDTGCFLLVEIERAEAFALFGRKNN